MREIKFRAWDKERPSDGMHYGKENDCTIATNLFGQTYYCDFLNYNVGDSNHLDYVDNDRFILMQYTGLKDKNKKEIYEGDIVIIQKEFGEYQSDFLPPTKTVAKLYGYSGEFCFDDDFVSMGNTYQNGREVIGNIHQNPKLLEKQK